VIISSSNWITHALTEVEIQMINNLPVMLAGLADQPVAVLSNPLLLGDLAGDVQPVPNQVLILVTPIA
jgi:hypothetical protein